MTDGRAVASQRRPFVLPAIALAAAALLALTALHASAYVPLDLWERNDFTEPVTMSPAQAYRYVLTATVPLGGLPADARLHMAGSMGMLDSTGTGHRLTYEYVWYPSEPYWFDDVRDRVTAQVVSEPHVTCLRAGCARYLVTYEPHLESFTRTWHPAWWRAWLQRGIRGSASFVPVPSSVKTSCPGGIDASALRRVIGSARKYLPYGGMHYPVPVIGRELSVPGTSYATFAPAAIAQAHDAASVYATRAIVSDTPMKDFRYRTVWLYVANPWPWKSRKRPRMWLQFASDDLEPACNRAPPQRRRKQTVFSENVLAFEDLGADAVFRSTEEARRRTHNAPHLREALLVAVTKTPSGATVSTKHDDGAAIWTGTFTYDRRGALIRAEYQRV